MTDVGLDLEAVVFDLGGVLLDWDPRYLYRRLFDDEDTMERFLAEICTLQWHAAHDRGVPFAQSCAALADRHPEHAELIWAWAQRSEEMVAGPIAGTVELLRELKAAGVRCYALTNMEAETYPLRRERFDFLGWFDGTVVSSHEGVSKPDPEIFRRLLSRFGLQAERTLMIDDAERNLDAACGLGLRTVLFRSPGQLRGSLVALGLLSEPGDAPPDADFTIRPCGTADRAKVLEIVNLAAEAYRGVIPEDRWHEPYMAPSELDAEIADGVVFHGCETGGRLLGVMGIQRVRDVELIRHAYVLPERQHRGVGGALLRHLREHSTTRMLVGTWAAADWAIRFYERRGFQRVSPELKTALLTTYWNIPVRQIETSVVLADPPMERPPGEHD